MLNTKDVKAGEGGLSKTLKPGNVKVKINSVVLEPNTFKPGSYHVVCNVETEPIEGFVGFAIDKNNPSLGNHAGQIGKVKAGQYSFADGATKSGIPVYRDNDIMTHIKRICLAVGTNWWDGTDGKYKTIEALVEAFNNDKPFKDIYIETCLAGKKYKNDKGYDNYDLFFAKYSGGKSGFSSDPAKVITFNEKEHVIEKAPENVASFDGNNAANTGTGAGPVNNDFKL